MSLLELPTCPIFSSSLLPFFPSFPSPFPASSSSFILFGVISLTEFFVYVLLKLIRFLLFLPPTFPRPEMWFPQPPPPPPAQSYGCPGSRGFFAVEMAPFQSIGHRFSLPARLSLQVKLILRSVVYFSGGRGEGGGVRGGA